MKVCCVTGCGRAVLVQKHVLCGAHYKRYIRSGDPGLAKIQPRSAMRQHPAFTKKESRA